VGAAVAAHVLALPGWRAVAAAGAIAAVSEALPVPGLGRGKGVVMDDNLVIPVVSGALLTACRLGP
jgi:dolichol kinase